MMCKHCGKSIVRSYSEYNLGWTHEGTSSSFCQLSMAEPESGDPGHGEWLKDEQRYEDGCKSDAAPHSTERESEDG